MSHGWGHGLGIVTVAPWRHRVAARAIHHERLPGRPEPVVLLGAKPEYKTEENE